jgi:hypothetical protein
MALSTGVYYMNFILKTFAFKKWQKKSSITDETLTKAILEIKQGLFDANLGSGL